MEIDASLQEKLRERAATGASVAELIRLIRAWHGTETDGDGTFFVVRYLVRTFEIPLIAARKIEGWEGLGCGGTTTDEDLEAILGEYVRK